MDLGITLSVLAVLAPIWAVLIVATVVGRGRAEERDRVAMRALLWSQVITASALTVVVSLAEGSVALRALAGAGFLLVAAVAAVSLLTGAGKAADGSSIARPIDPRVVVWLAVPVVAADAIILAGLTALGGLAGASSVVVGFLVLAASVTLLRRHLGRRGTA